MPAGVGGKGLGNAGVLWSRVSPGDRMAGLAAMLREQLRASAGVRREFSALADGHWCPGRGVSTIRCSTKHSHLPGLLGTISDRCCRARSPTVPSIPSPLFPVAALFF